MKDNVGTTFRSCPFRDLKFGASITNPSCGLCAFLIRKGLDLHLMGDHKGRIKPETKLTDDFIGILCIFKFLYKFGGSGKSDLVDVFFDFLGSHSKTPVRNGRSEEHTSELQSR